MLVQINDELFHKLRDLVLEGSSTRDLYAEGISEGALNALVVMDAINQLRAAAQRKIQFDDYERMRIEQDKIALYFRLHYAQEIESHSPIHQGGLANAVTYYLAKERARFLPRLVRLLRRFTT